MLLIPSILFFVLLFVGREELGLKGIVISVVIWMGLLFGSSFLEIPYVFTSAEALLDIVLLFIIFSGNMNITIR